MMRAPAVLTIGLFLAVTLAGCSDDAPAGNTGGDLAAGTGAIAGLLVDDRFRPIHLVDRAPQTEFEATGFVLLQETGQRAMTSVNGEFTFADLEPGTYTVRVQADGHEASPQTVGVTAGEFSESHVVARRIVNTGGSIITQEHAIFIDCWYANPVVLHTEVNCFLDLSRDSKRGALRANMSDIPDVSHLVVEFFLNQQGNYRVLLGYGEGEAVQETYGSMTVQDDVYGKLVFTTDAEADPDALEADGIDGIADISREMIAVVFPLGDEVAEGEYVGAGIATEAQVMLSAFIGEPEVDVTAYCVLC